MIDLTGVSYSYGDTPLLQGVDLALPQGSFHFLTGPSGSGKTTLLRLCYLDLKPHDGTVRLFGQATGGLDRDGVAMMRRRIGIVHQSCEFLDHLTVAQNVALPLAVRGRNPLTADNDLADLLAWTGLGDRAQAYPPELSGGERQRAALARAVITSPEMILADEPTGNVDWDMSLRILQLLLELNRMGKTVLIATHDLALIRQAKSQVQARVLRLTSGALATAGSDL
ncbi:MAG: ATP-binding cassette domain-containing protein [Pseudomonadota bacterium]